MLHGSSSSLDAVLDRKCLGENVFSPVHLHAAGRLLAQYRVPLLPKLLDYFGRFVFGCWFPHTVKAGHGLVLGYGGLGVVVHSLAVIGNNVHIDQNVTIGGSGTQGGVPLIGNNVYIGAGAKVLGPIEIGSGSIVGANAVAISSVPPKSLVVGVPARVVKSNIEIDGVLFHRR